MSLPKIQVAPSRRRPNFKALTEVTAHRPWPLPKGPWIMTMSWVDLLFAHWSVDAALLRPLVPEALELETYDGRAWLGVVPFRMESVGPRGLGWLPGRLPSPRAFPELNLRTYVNHGGKSGVFFFSLDATSRLAVEGARTFFHLPYVKADIDCAWRDGWVNYRCQRTDRRLGPGLFEGRYRPKGEVLEFPSDASAGEGPGGLDLWLTERYCLYSHDGKGRLWRSEIHHLPWPLQRAELELQQQTVGASHGLSLLPEQVEHLHFVHRLDVVAWGLERVA